VSGTHLYEEGNYQITVIIRDEGGSNTTAVSTITVTDSPLTAGPPVPQLTSVEGKSLTAQVATFTDANQLGVIADFSSTIDWGDGTTSAGIIGQRADGTFTVTGTHTYIEESAPGTPYAVRVNIKDIGGATTTATTTAVVLDAKLSSQGALIQGIEGSSTGRVLVATFVDANPDSTLTDFTVAPGVVTIDWGDGSPLYTVPAADLSSVGSPTGVTYQVFAAHTYAEAGSYQIITTIKDAGGSATIAHGEADVADATLTPLPAGQLPVVSTTEAVRFPVPVFGQPVNLGPVGAFSDQNPNAPASDFTATIDWGDGTPRQTGSVTAGGTAGLFFVNGSHTYADAGSGRYTITMSVVDKDGASVTFTNTASVADVPITVVGKLDPRTDSCDPTDAITNINQPKFYGTSEPRSDIYVYATRQGTSSRVLIGVTQADSSGAWKLTSSALPDGKYTITVHAVDQFGKTTADKTILPNSKQGPLVIDTVAPKVTNVVFTPHTGTVYVTFQDNLSGMLRKTLVDASNYNLTGVSTFVHIGTFTVTSILTGPATTPKNFVPAPVTDPTAPIMVAIQFNKGHVLKDGHYLFTIFSGIRGVTDVACNPLDGEFYGKFPSGNNKPGGNFVAELDAVHGVGLPPKTVIGTASPLGPNGGPSQPFTALPSVNKSKVTKKVAVTPKVALPTPTTKVTHKVVVNQGTTKKK
jgi:hypothetical protein